MPLLTNLARQYRPGRSAQQGGGPPRCCRCKPVRVTLKVLGGDEKDVGAEIRMVTHTYTFLQSMIFNVQKTTFVSSAD